MIILALLAAWILNMCIFNPTAIEAAEDNYIYVPVRSGDTLWNIAAEYRPEGKDLRDYVRLVAAVNGADDYMIRTGQTLRLPQ